MIETYEGMEADVTDFAGAGDLLDARRSGGDDEMSRAFRRFFDEMPYHARNFAADEFIVLGPSNANAGGKCFGKNEFPHPTLWPNVVPLVAALDAIREDLSYGVRITNCYRAPAYNECVGGVPASMHRNFMAADFVCAEGDSVDWAAAASRVRKGGAFQGGIGIYSSFVHVDARGSKADWDNR